MGAYLPQGWPEAVRPPGSEGLEESAVAWLLDIVPPEYRRHTVVRRHPAALASMPPYHAGACLEGARQGYRTARAELAETVPPHAVDGVLAAYRLRDSSSRPPCAPSNWSSAPCAARRSHLASDGLEQGVLRALAVRRSIRARVYRYWPDQAPSEGGPSQARFSGISASMTVPSAPGFCG
jgi:hypothetical protein